MWPLLFFLKAPSIDKIDVGVYAEPALNQVTYWTPFSGYRAVTVL